MPMRETFTVEVFEYWIFTLDLDKTQAVRDILTKAEKGGWEIITATRALSDNILLYCIAKRLKGYAERADLEK